jgi:hypothetical protein
MTTHWTETYRKNCISTSPYTTTFTISHGPRVIPAYYPWYSSSYSSHHRVIVFVNIYYRTGNCNLVGLITYCCSFESRGLIQTLKHTLNVSLKRWSKVTKLLDLLFVALAKNVVGEIKSVRSVLGHSIVKLLKYSDASTAFSYWFSIAKLIHSLSVILIQTLLCKYAGFQWHFK